MEKYFNWIMKDVLKFYSEHNASLEKEKFYSESICEMLKEQPKSDRCKCLTPKTLTGGRSTDKVWCGDCGKPIKPKKIEKLAKVIYDMFEGAESRPEYEAMLDVLMKVDEIIDFVSEEGQWKKEKD